MAIVLIGYMGSGKSTIGRLLAKRIGADFHDLDDYIESEEGMDIPTIFSQRGEIYFRKKEHEYLKQLLAEKPGAVLALGGGTPCYANNMKLLLDEGHQVVYLSVGIPELLKRLLPAKKKRPLIADVADEELAEFFGKHLFERRPFYTQAPYQVQADQGSPAEVVQQIREKLGS